ncbi:50S ribosomal protein P1 [Candidatus Woesearchaeota archaeon]|nr:50S ribosomal protein P1 [Candidatus Woesearchaeota archaeon]
MEYVYAAMLLHKAGKKVDDASIVKVLQAAGVQADAAKAKAVAAALDGVDIEKVIKESQAMPVAAAAAPAAAGGREAKKDDAAEKAKAEAEAKKSEEAAAAGLGSLFG